jgi:hypothetical protein
MEILHALIIWPDQLLLSLLVLFFIAVPILYGARQAMHSLLRAVFRAISNPLRLMSRWLFKTAEVLRERNKQVVLSRGREEVSHSINKEFDRVTNLVERDLHGYPALQRKLMDEITRIEEEFQKCGEVPPPPPEWTKAVAAIAKIKPSGDGLVERILEDISNSIDEIYERVINEYRESSKQRHNILKNFMPFWRSVDRTLKKVDKDLSGMQQSAAKIDEQVEKYKQIHAKSEQAEHSLTASSTILFVISLLAIMIAAGGAFVNFWLIERPMSAMVGGSEYIVGDIQASYLAAMVIILFETLMGLFLMESLGYTHLFPLNNINNRMRRWLVWISFTILLILAGVEVALAEAGAGRWRSRYKSNGQLLGARYSQGSSDDPRLHPALRAGLRGNSFGISDPFRTHGFRRPAGAGYSRTGFCHAFYIQHGATDRQGHRVSL